MFCDYSMLVTLCKIGKVYFRLLDTNGFNVRAKSRRLTASGSPCRLHKNQHLSFQIPIRSGMQGHLLKRSPVALLGVPWINETIISIYYLLLFLSSDRQCRCFDISAIIFIGNKSKQPCKGQRNCFK